MKPIIANSEELLGAAKEYLVEHRPTSAAHLENGKYAATLEGWKAQEQVVLARVAKEAAAARLTTAPKESLNELLQSKFDVVLPEGKLCAEGCVVLMRYRTTSDGFNSGFIKQGTRFRRKADDARGLAEAYYESTEPVYVGTSDGVIFVGDIISGGIGYVQYVNVPIRAIQAGAPSNHPQQAATVSESCFSVVGSLFDPTLSKAKAEVSGGSDNELEKARILGPHLGRGKNGPTLSAICAGILSTPGVAHFAASEDLANGGICAWVADSSWAWSAQLNERVKANLKSNEWLGFGCKVTLGRVIDYPIGVRATVVLRDKQYLANQAEILANIRKALQAYFNDREDWYTWTLEGVMAAICRSDRRIMGIERGSRGDPLCVVRGECLDDKGTVLNEPSRYLGVFELHHYSGINESYLVLTDAKVFFDSEAQKEDTLRNTRLHWTIGDQRTQITFHAPRAS